MIPVADAIKVAVALFKIVEAHRAELPEGKDRQEVERLIQESKDALRELWLYEPLNPVVEDKRQADERESRRPRG